MESLELCRLWGRLICHRPLPQPHLFGLFCMLSSAGILQYYLWSNVGKNNNETAYFFRVVLCWQTSLFKSVFSAAPFQVYFSCMLLNWKWKNPYLCMVLVHVVSKCLVLSKFHFFSQYFVVCSLKFSVISFVWSHACFVRNTLCLCSVSFPFTNVEYAHPSMQSQEEYGKSPPVTVPVSQSPSLSDPHHHHQLYLQQQPPLQFVSPNASHDTNTSQSFIRQRPIGPIRRVADKNVHNSSTAAGGGGAGGDAGPPPDSDIGSEALSALTTATPKTGNMFLDFTSPPTRCRIPSLRSPTKLPRSACTTPDATQRSLTPARSGNAASHLATPNTSRRGVPRSVTPTHSKVKAAPEVRSATLPRKKKDPPASSKNSLMSTSAHASASGGGLKGGNSSHASIKVVDDSRSKTLPLPGIHATFSPRMACWASPRALEEQQRVLSELGRFMCPQGRVKGVCSFRTGPAICDRYS